MELIPGQGTTKLLFGMNRKKVEEIMGKPDREFADDDQNAIWVYNAPMLRLTFYEDEGFRFGYLICANPEATLFGEKVIGETPGSVKAKLPARHYKTWENETFDLAENEFNEDNWLILQSEFGRISKVELGALIDQKDEIVWKAK